MGGLILLLLSALSSTHAQAVTLHVHVPYSPMSLDWTGQVTVSDAHLVANLCEGLFRFEYPAEKLVPAIASSVTKSKDLKEYTFQISEQAKWSDGRSIYAQDFVDGWQRLISPQSTSIYSYYLYDVVNAREYREKKITSFDEVGVRATKDRTLVVKFNHPQPNWEPTTAFWPLFPVRKDLIEKFGNNWWRAGTLASSGPFVLSSFEPGKSALLKRNPYYPKSKSNVTEVDVDFALSQESAEKKYEKKFFHFVYGIRSEKSLGRKDYLPIPLLRHYVLVANAERFPLNDRFFRLAILSAVDRSKMMPKEYAQFSKATALIHPSLWKSSEDLTVPYDPKKAKEYLVKSGILLKKGFKIAFLTGLNEPFYSVSKNIASQIETVLGLTVDILAYKNQEFETFSNLGEYNMLMLSWTAKVRTARDFLVPYSNKSPTNRSHFSNPDYTAAIDSGDFKKAQSIISKENAVIYPLFFEKTGFLAHPSIKNIFFDHRGFPVLKDVVLK